MKLADIRLDTVYADHDGRPLIVLSLDKVAVSKAKFGYGSGRIHDQGLGDRSFGVVALRPAYVVRNITVEQLVEEASKYRGARPEKEAVIGDFEVFVATLRNIVEDWDDHLIRRQAEQERRQAEAARAARARTVRAETLRLIEERLPEGIELRNHGEHSDYAQIRLDHLLRILKAASPSREAPTS